MPGATGPLPKTYSVIAMLEILAEIIDWKMDTSVEWETEDGCLLSVQDMLDQADIVIKREKGETCR